MPSTGDHPDPGLIAAHAERRLTGAEAARMDEHLADCPTCHEVFAETLRFVLDEEAEEALPRSSLVAIPFVRRPAFRMAAILAVAASVFLAFQQLWRARSERAAPPLIAELAQAMGTKRFVEPRLTGGFQHGRLIVLLSGDAPQGLDAQSPAVLTAVARIRERTEGDTSPDGLAALAVTYLVSGDIGKAVKALESATAQAPKNPRLQSDLAAAYLVRASRLDEPADLPKALEAAETAIELEDAPDEAWFNRALALESLHLVDSAKKAWEDFLKRDSTSAWADEARKHLEELPPAQQSTIEEDRARARAALAEGPTAIDRLADESPSILADYFLTELLPTWADAQLTGHPNALVLITQAQQVGEALFRTTGDALPRDAALALASPPSGPSRDPPRTQALGYKALHEAQRLYDLRQPSCETFRESHHFLETGGSPYSAWARERIVACAYPAEPPNAFPELTRIQALAERRGYLRLLGRVHWMQGLFHLMRGEFTHSLDQYRLSRDAFRALRDPESEASVLVRFAQVLQTVGDHRSAWRERLRGLALFDSVREPSRRHAVLAEASLASLFQKLLRTSLHLETAAVEAARHWSNSAAISDALIQRSGILQALGSDDQAVADLVEARQWILRVGDGPKADNLIARADEVEGQILINREPERAAACLERALAYFERTTPALVPGLRLLLARAQAAQGHDSAAEAELEAGIRLVESQRASLKDAALQASFFDQAASLFDEMVGFQLDKRHDPERALAFVERGRARQLLDSLGAPRTMSRTGTKPPVEAGLSPLEAKALQRELPASIALVYYASLGDRLLSWVVTRDGVRFAELSLGIDDDLQRLVAAHETAMERRAVPSLVREQAADLYDRLIRPLEPLLRGHRTLILIPPGTLQSVAFASFWDRQTGRFLVDDHLVGVAPSGSVFVRASTAAAAAARNGTPTLLAVGNPRFDRNRWAGVPSLPAAEAEAAEIANLYEHAKLLTGREATTTELLQGARRSTVVHYAGHAIGDDALATAHLLFASDSVKADSGALYLNELRSGDFPRTRVVVLAACRTAAGDVSRTEGALSLARPFLAAGVPNVVASLWDVDDATSRTFFVAFHRALLAEGDPLTALHRTQLAFLRDQDPLLAHPATWAGFVAIGGIDPRKLL